MRRGRLAVAAAQHEGRRPVIEERGPSESDVVHEPYAAYDGNDRWAMVMAWAGPGMGGTPVDP